MRGCKEVNDRVNATVHVHEGHRELKGHFESHLLRARWQVACLSHHELDDIEIVRAEAHNHSHQHHQSEQAGPPVVPFVTRHRVILGSPAQLYCYLHVTK